MTSARQDRTTLFAGVAKIDITPTWPLPLAGFASRRGFSASVASPIHLRAAFLETRTGSKISRAVIVSADLLWWPPEHVDAYRAEIARRFDLPAHSVILTATHNHSGPQPSSRFAPSLGLCDARFVARLEVALLDVVTTAARSLEPVTVRRGRVVHRLGMNRRASIDGHIRLAPNPDGQDDPELTVISLHRASGTPAGVVIHYACHPVISTANLISGEFSGVAMDAIERQTGATAIFLQGCSGDINPGDAGRTAFANGGETGITRAGTALANTALDVLHGNSQRLDPVPIKTETREHRLPFAWLPTAAEIQAAISQPGIDGEWGEAMLADPARLQPSAPLTMERVDLARGLNLLTFNAEMVVAYGLFAKAVSAGTTLPVSCSNGMIGYVPTATQIKEGGYESVGSARYFLLPSRFSPGVERIVRDGIAELVGAGPD